jgi:predicted nucleic-acid-binding protein
MRIAVDTNILVRFLTQDDATQAASARDFLRANVCHVQTSVLLELEWVLRSVYRYTAEQICHVLRILLQTAGIEVDEPERLLSAVNGLEAGLDFTDAFHLAGAVNSSGFATFDREMLKHAPRIFTRPRLIHP